MKRDEVEETSIFAVRMVNIDSSVSVKMVRKLVKSYTRSLITFRKRVTNMVKKGDWSLYIQFYTLEALVLFLYIDFSEVSRPIQQQIYVRVPPSSHLGPPAFISMDDFHLLPPLSYKGSNLMSLSYLSAGFTTPIRNKIEISLSSVRIATLNMSFRVEELVNEIKIVIGGVLYWKSVRNTKRPGIDLLINMSDNLRASSVIEMAAKIFTHSSGVEVGYLPAEFSPEEFLEPFSYQFSSLVLPDEKEAGSNEGGVIPRNSDLLGIDSI